MRWFMVLAVFVRSVWSRAELDDILDGLGLGGPGGAPKICQKGVPVPRPLWKLKKGTLIANGCGPQGMAIEEPFGLWRCCNRHDVCFSSCGTSFQHCEKRFSQCLKKRCKQPENMGQEKECMQQAESMTSMTKMFGQSSHSKTMREVCDCVPEVEAGARHREFVVDLYTRFGPVEKAKDDAFIDSLLEKHAGKEGNLYYDLYTKYGGAKGFVEFDNVPNTFELEGPSGRATPRTEM